LPLPLGGDAHRAQLEHASLAAREADVAQEDVPDDPPVHLGHERELGHVGVGAADSVDDARFSVLAEGPRGHVRDRFTVLRRLGADQQALDHERLQSRLC
jgi:hypothetical protein